MKNNAKNIEGSPSLLAYCLSGEKGNKKDLLIQMGFSESGSMRTLTIDETRVITIGNKQQYATHTINNVTKGQIFVLTVTEIVLGKSILYCKRKITIN